MTIPPPSVEPPAELPAELSAMLHKGCVIPAHPLALDEHRRLDERRQRALTRYYLDAGAGGIAVGVHTTQFGIRRPDVGLLRPVLELAAETAREHADRTVLLVAGACGETAQAVAEAELAASYGYSAVLLSPGGLKHRSEDELLDRARRVAAVLPVIGFYLQPAVGGRALSAAFWRALADTPGVVAIKIAPFDRYATADVVRAVCASERRDEVALYTGNDDNILADLVTPFRFRAGEEIVEKWIVGGLLGQWAVWTHSAVHMLEQAHAAARGDQAAASRVLRLGPQLTDANGAVFDVANGFSGCIAGIHEVLRGQGLLAGRWCLDPAEGLSPGQAEEIGRVRRAYPWLTDDEFVADRIDGWLR